MPDAGCPFKRLSHTADDLQTALRLQLFGLGDRSPRPTPSGDCCNSSPSVAVPSPSQNVHEIRHLRPIFRPLKVLAAGPAVYVLVRANPNEKLDFLH